MHASIQMSVISVALSSSQAREAPPNRTRKRPLDDTHYDPAMIALPRARKIKAQKRYWMK